MRALLTTGGPRMKKLHGRYLEVYGPYQIMLNVDGISIYTRTYVTTDDDQMGKIYLGEEELKVRRIGHDAMMEQDAVHIGHRSGSECDADKNLGKNGLHAARSGSYESPTGRSQSRSYLRSRKNTNNGPPYGRTGSLDELPGGRESGRRRPIHFGQRFCQEF